MSCPLSLACNVQTIMETSNGRDYWIHVSYKKNCSKNRHQGNYSVKSVIVASKNLCTFAARPFAH